MVEKRIPLILKDGVVSQIPKGDVMPSTILSGTDLIDESFIIPENYQMINFTILSIDDDLTLDGDLWLA